MRATFRLGKIAGIGVGVHYSWFVLLAVVTWSLAVRFFPALFPFWSEPTYWVAALIAALMLFVSVLVHEFAHSLVARARGIHVHGITLFMLGGVSNLAHEPRSAREEFAIAAVGPAASVALSGAFWLALLAFPNKATPLPGVIAYLALVNLVLAAFNLAPAFPLDGGRVFRSIVWGITGSRSRATTLAARGGQVFGALLVALGAIRIFHGGYYGMLWVILGLFLFGAATAETSGPSATGLGGARVRDAMARIARLRSKWR